MPTYNRHSEGHASLTWQQSQQQRETVFSVLHLIETETFLDLEIGSLNSDYFSECKSIAPIEVMPNAIAEMSMSDVSAQLENVTKSTKGFDTVIDDAIPADAAPTWKPSHAEAVTDTQTVDSDTEFRLISHASAPGQAENVAQPTFGWMHYQTPTYQVGLIDFANLPDSGTDDRWSNLSGWGEINVLNALRMTIDQPLLNSGIQSDAPVYLKHLGFDKAWANGYTGQGVVVADIDTGIDLTNHALMSGLHLNQFSWNFVNNTANVQDDNGHGTITAMEIGAHSTIDPRIMGGAYGSELMVLKAMDASGQAASQTIGTAIHYAVDHGASVINLSLGAHSTDMEIQNAMQYAYDRGAIVVAAAGNDGTSSVEFPAAYAKVFSTVIAVGATQNTKGHEAMAAFSNTAGDHVFNFVDAIGTGINGFSLDGQINAWSGTSMSAPLVAAEAAILKSANPSLTSSQIVQNILHSADSLYDMDLAYGPSMSMGSEFAYVPHEQHY